MTSPARALGLLLVLAAACTGEAKSGPLTPSGVEATPTTAPATSATSPADADDRPWRAPTDETERPVATGPTPKVASYEEFKAKAAPLRCDRAIRCGHVAASGREGCIREGTALADELLGVDRGLAAGRYTFDAAAAGECLRLLAESPCHVNALTLPSGCLAGPVSAALRPAVAPGGACERWEECVDGLCTGDLGCPGVCRARTVEVGGRCDHNGLCSDDLYCEDGTCKARADVGGPCGSHWQACKPGLRCVGASGGDREWGGRSGTCERPQGRDQLCQRESLGNDCRADLYCDFGSDAPRCRDRLPVGASCRWLDACADGLACVGLTLAEYGSGNGMRAVAQAGTCAPHRDVGDACDPSSEFDRCPSDLRCDPQSKRCVARGPSGARCTTADECPSYHTCDARTRTCVPQVTPGASCRVGGDDFTGHCFLGACDPQSRRCVPRCARKGR